MSSNSRRFAFDGGAGTYVGTAVAGFLITVLTLGLGFPFALVLRQRWRAKHSWIEGRRLIFTGTATGLLGHWIKWLLLSIATLGIYAFWVGPRVARWIWEHTNFDPVQPTVAQVPIRDRAVLPAQATDAMAWERLAAEQAAEF